MRAWIEHGLNQKPGLQELFYMGPMFRRERRHAPCHGTPADWHFEPGNIPDDQNSGQRRRPPTKWRR